MKKRAIDLTWDELADAGREAAAAAIADSHARGLSTLGLDDKGRFVETHPDGTSSLRTRTELEARLFGIAAPSVAPSARPRPSA